MSKPEESKDSSSLLEERHLPIFSDENLNKYQETNTAPYLKQMKLGFDVPKKDALQVYEKQRFKETAFDGVELPGSDKKTFGQQKAKLVDAAPLPVFKQTTDALKKTKEFSEAQKDFEDSINALTKMKNGHEMGDYPFHAAKFIKEAKDTGIKAIEKQHEEESKALDTLFKSDDYKAKLATALEVSPNQMGDIQKKMKESLEKSQKETLANFKNAVQKAEEDCYLRINSEESRIKYLLTMYKSNKVMKKEIERLMIERAQKAGEEQPGVSIGFHIDKNALDFTGIDVKDLQKVRSLTGHAIKAKSDGSLHIDLPRGFFGFYKGKNLEIIANDIAMNLRAKGYKKVTLESNSTDDKTALRGGRAQVMAALKAGFHPDDITIKVGGTIYKSKLSDEEKKNKSDKIKTFEDLYHTETPDKEKRFQTALSGAYKAHVTDFKNPDPKNEAAFKKEIGRLKDEAKQERIKTENAAPAP